MKDEERYEIRGKVGEGGRGAVYRAYDRQLHRHVAIKRLFTGNNQPGGDSSDDILKESHALSAINSPHIVRVFDIARDEDGPYVVMELLEGKTLHEIVSRAPLVPSDFMAVAEQALEALIAAHDAKLLHRDIKPGNLMLTWLPSGRMQLKLLDFGLAKFTEKPAVQTAAQKGSVLGSIYFMAPEQFDRSPLDVRSDLYSLGCVLYHCLTGKYPFDGDTPTAVMAAHIRGDCENLAAQRPDLAPALCHWVMSLIARTQDERPADAQKALDAFLQAKKATAPVTTAKVPSGPRLIVGHEAKTATQRVAVEAHTGTQPTHPLLAAKRDRAHPTSTTLVAAGTPTTKVVHTTKRQGLPPLLLSICGVLVVTIIALGVAMAMRGDPDKTVAPPTPAQFDSAGPAKAVSAPKEKQWDAAREFLAGDTNNDFKLSRDEFVQNTRGIPGKLNEQFKQLDTDGNGFLSRAEFRKLPGLNQKPTAGPKQKPRNQPNKKK